jgi:transposase
LAETILASEATSKGRKGRPNYPYEFKKQLAQAACQPGVSVAKLAMQHGVNANMVFKWRRRYQAGQFDAPVSSPAFLPVTLQPESAAVAETVSQCPDSSATSKASALDGTIEVRFAQAVVRVQGHVDVAVLSAVLASLNRC